MYCWTTENVAVSEIRASPPAFLLGPGSGGMLANTGTGTSAEREDRVAGAAHLARYIGLVGKMMSVKILLFFQSRSWRFSLLLCGLLWVVELNILSIKWEQAHRESKQALFCPHVCSTFLCADSFFRTEPCLQKQNWPGLLSARYFSNLGLKEVLLKPDCPSLGLSAKLCLTLR